MKEIGMRARYIEIQVIQKNNGLTKAGSGETVEGTCKG